MESCQRGCFGTPVSGLQSHLQALVNAEGTKIQVFAGLSLKTKRNDLPSRRYMHTKQTLLLQCPELEAPRRLQKWRIHDDKLQLIFLLNLNQQHLISYIKSPLTSEMLDHIPCNPGQNLGFE